MRAILSILPILLFMPDPETGGAASPPADADEISTLQEAEKELLAARADREALKAQVASVQDALVTLQAKLNGSQQAHARAVQDEINKLNALLDTPAPADTPPSVAAQSSDTSAPSPGESAPSSVSTPFEPAPAADSSPSASGTAPSPSSEPATSTPDAPKADSAPAANA
jgi:hypothetical protein